MRHIHIGAILLFLLLVPARGQEVVDRIAARIQNDIIVESEVRELSAYQHLVQGRRAAANDLLSELIEQWIVEKDAAAANFPPPADVQVDNSLEGLRKVFPSEEAFRARLSELGLTESAVRRILRRQIYEARYLDFKFRPAIQIEEGQIEQYYQGDLARKLKERSQTLPPLEEVAEQIREVLTQAEINKRAARWLEETKSRLTIEILSGGGQP